MDKLVAVIVASVMAACALALSADAATPRQATATPRQATAKITACLRKAGATRVVRRKAYFGRARWQGAWYPVYVAWEYITSRGQVLGTTTAQTVKLLPAWRRVPLKRKINRCFRPYNGSI